jgi:protein-tyrosine phosphatase
MENEHATLWHCTAGKDRAGLATVIVLEILGVDRGLIIDDYLLTQTYLKPEVDELIVLLTEADPTLDPDLLRIFFGTDREYIQTVYKVVEETYGNFDAFVHTGLQVTDAQIESFCQHCLIKG